MTDDIVSNNSFYKYQYLFHFILRAFLISILCLLCLVGLFFLIYFGDYFLHNSKGNYRAPLFSAYVIVSPSMVPTIMVNDGIVIKRIDHDRYRVGDIISFKSSDINYQGLTITHRVVDKESSEYESSIYTTKGDNNPIVDPSKVETSAIYGKVLFKIPNLGNVQSFFSKPTNFFLCLLIPAIIFIGYDFIRIFTYVNQRK